jgi:hypothetical protein
VTRCSAGQMPGSGETGPKPFFCAMPTHSDHTSAAARAARTSSSQDPQKPREFAISDGQPAAVNRSWPNLDCQLTPRPGRMAGARPA